MWVKEFVGTITMQEEAIPSDVFEALDDELQGIPGAIESSEVPDQHYQIMGDWRELDYKRFQSLVMSALNRVANQTGEEFEVQFNERYRIRP